MDNGTYILTFDKSQSVWGQKWYESIPINITSSEIEVLFPSDGNYYCYCDKEIAKEIHPSKNADYIKQKLSSLFFNDTAREITLTKFETECGHRFNHIYRPVYLSSFRDTYNFNPLNYVPKEYYKDPPIKDLRVYYNYVRQLEIIVEELFDVFKVVEPDESNLQTHGNAIRNIIFLACTEVDALFKQILKNNGLEKSNDRYKTNDYFELKKPLRIDEYSVSFSNFDTIKDFSPFQKWESPNTTQTLTWYDAYNKVKHDRINNFEFANLENAIESTLAFALLLIVSYGYHNDIWNEKIGRIIEVKKEPLWLLKDFYLPPILGSEIVYDKHPDICKK